MPRKLVASALARSYALGRVTDFWRLGRHTAASDVMMDRTTKNRRIPGPSAYSAGGSLGA